MIIEEISIGCVKTPVKYYVAPKGSCYDSDWSSLDCMGRDFEEAPPAQVDVDKLKPGLPVAVQAIKNRWRRGKVIGVGSSFAKIFYLDSGEVEDEVPFDTLHDLVEPWNTKPPFLAKKLEMKGILPRGQDTNWSVSSLASVRFLLFQAKTFFALAEASTSKSYHGGEIVACIPAPNGLDEYVNLRHILLKKGFAIVDGDEDDGFVTADETFPKQPTATCTPVHQSRRQVPSILYQCSDGAIAQKSSNCARQDVGSSCLQRPFEEEYRESTAAFDLGTPSNQARGEVGDGETKLNDVNNAIIRAKTNLKKFVDEVLPSDYVVPTATTNGHNLVDCSNPLNRQEKAASQSNTLYVDHDPSGRTIRLRSHMDKLGNIHPSLLSYCRSDGISAATQLQSAMWPALLSRQSVVAVGSRKSGKTMGFVIPMLNELLSCQSFPGPRVGGEPLYVVVCPSQKVANKVHQKITQFAASPLLNVINDRGHVVPISCVVAHKFSEESLLTKLTNGCHILVATPPCLFRIININKYTSFARCFGLIFDDADELFDYHAEEVKNIMKAFTEERVALGHCGQVVVSAKKWTVSVQQFTSAYITNCHKSSLGPTHIFVSHLDVVAYAGVKVETHFIDSSAGDNDFCHLRMTKLTEVLEMSRQGDRRVAIFCQDSKSAEVAASAVSTEQREVILVDEVRVQGLDVIMERLARFKVSRNAILILSDQIDLDPIGIVDFAVHFDVPRQSKKLFATRHYHMRRNFKSAYSLDNIKDPLPRAESHVIVTPDDAPAFKSLVDFMKRSNVQPSPAFAKCLQDQELKDALSKIDQGLCRSIKLRGACRDTQRGCGGRHFVMREVDMPSKWLQSHIGGTVDMKVTTVTSPVQFYGLVVGVDAIQGRLALAMRLARVAHQKTMQSLKVVEIGTMCMFLDRDDCLKRAEIVQKSSKEVHSVNIFLIDEGVANIVHVHQLFELPMELQEQHFPRKAIEVILAGIIPPDNDSFWDMKSVEWEEKVIRPGEEDSGIICQISPIIVLGSTVWSNDIQVLKKLQSMKFHSPIVNIASYLLENEFGCANESHLTKLQQMCHNAGLEIAYKVCASDVPKKTLPKSPQPIKPNLERLSNNELVVVTEVYNPDCFFVGKAIHMNSLLTLRRDIAAYVCKQVSSTFGPLLQQGSVCLADMTSSPEGGSDEVRNWSGVSFQRARLLEVKYDTAIDNIEEERVPDPNKVLCQLKVFFVDSGIVRTVAPHQVCAIPDYFITRLPFQAVECSLAGIKPNQETWTTQAGNLLFDLTKDQELTCSIQEVSNDPQRGDDESWCRTVKLSVHLHEANSELHLASAMLEAGHALPIEGFEISLNSSGLHEAAPSLPRITNNIKQADEINNNCPDQNRVFDVIKTSVIPFDLPCLSVVEDLTESWKRQPPFRLTWWEAKSSLHLQVMINNVAQVSDSYFYLNIESFDMLVQYISVSNDEITVIDTDCLSFVNEIVPAETQFHTRGLTLNLVLKKASPKLWHLSSPFVQKDGQPLRSHWIQHHIDKSEDCLSETMSQSSCENRGPVDWPSLPSLKVRSSMDASWKHRIVSGDYSDLSTSFSDENSADEGDYMCAANAPLVVNPDHV